MYKNGHYSVPFPILNVLQFTRGLGHELCGGTVKWSTTWPTRGLGHRLSQ